MIIRRSHHARNESADADSSKASCSLLNAAMSASGDTYVSGIFHIVLSKKNLSGTAQSVATYYDTVAQTFETKYDNRALTRIACP